MHLSLKHEGECLFEGLSTVEGQIANDHGDLKMTTQMHIDRSPPVEVCLKLYRDEFIQVGILHRASVAASLVEVAQLISAGASFRRIRDRVTHWQRYWELNDEDVLSFLQCVESPLETLKRELAVSGNTNRTAVFGFHKNQKIVE